MYSQNGTDLSYIDESIFIKNHYHYTELLVDVDRIIHQECCNLVMTQTLH